MTDRKTVVVVGGGWSGIAAAWYLSLAGWSVTVLDEGEQPGGRSALVSLGDRQVTLGGKNIGSRYTRFRDFVAANGGTEFEYFGINSSRVERGRVVTVDSRSRFRASIGYARHSRPTDVWRFAKLVRLVGRGEPERFLGGPGFTELANRLGDPDLGQYFGSNLRSQLIRAATVRMNGAEPDEVYLGNFGTNLGMLLDSFDQVAGSFRPVFDALVNRVSWKSAHRVERLLVDTAGRVIGARARNRTGSVEVLADEVIVATPAPAAAELLVSLSPAIAELLRGIQYFPVATAVVEYSRPIFNSQTRAQVFQPSSPLSNAGSYGVQDLNVVRYTFSGRAARQLLSKPIDQGSLLAEAERQLQPYHPLDGAHRVNVATAQWAAGLCAYSRRHWSRMLRVTELMSGLAGVAITGDYVQGASIEACFRAAEQCVAQLVGSNTGTESVTESAVR
jgi:protoporphyrinogen/coproporphyrinogen III oxidase